MNNTKVYTAQEMREAADNFWVGGVICEVKDGQGRVVKQIKDDVVIAMLRQAADTEEENIKLKEQNEWYERQPELMGETAREALSLLKAQEAEIAELRECLKEAISKLNCHIDGNPETCKDQWCILFDHENKSNCIMCKWRKALEGMEDGK